MLAGSVNTVTEFLQNHKGAILHILKEHCNSVQHVLDKITCQFLRRLFYY